MDHFSFPADFESQKSWAQTLDVKLVDATYHRMRKLAVRRTIFAAVEQAFEQIPQLDRVVFSFNYDKKSIKDSMHAFADSCSDKEEKKIKDQFNKIMGSARSRVGQDTNTWEGLSVFFSGAERTLNRDNYRYFIEQIFNENTLHWSNELESQWNANLIDQATPPATQTHKGPRL